MQLKINVDGQRLECKDPYTVKGARNFVECAFTFSADWALLDKWALFKRDGGDETYEMEVTENKCVVPSECLQSTGRFLLSVIGRDANNDIIATASSVFAVVLENGLEVGEENCLTVTYLVETLSLIKNLRGQVVDSGDAAKLAAEKAAGLAAAAEKAAERSERAAAGVQTINDQLDEAENLAAQTKKNADDAKEAAAAAQAAVTDPVMAAAGVTIKDGKLCYVYYKEVEA